MFTGFILTDTKQLAPVIRSSQDKLKEILSDYASACASYINWQLVDVADSMYDDIDKSDWRSFARMLNDYYIGLGLDGVQNCPLFIIGGDDIVPMPRIESPLAGRVGNEYLCADFAYCFEPTKRVRLHDFISTKPRFAVGRLPLTRDWDIEALKAYLCDCVDSVQTGVSIRGAAMTTTQSWLRASREMMRDIPISPLDSDYVPLNNRMIVSPDLDTQYSDMYDGYIHELKKVDFLVCNLHGSDRKGVAYFVGEDTSHSKYTVAVQPSMMEQTAPYIFNTVACFGGRYIGYELEDSMLLSAMAYGTMLYSGSCEIALGGPDREGNSELMMKLFTIYQHKGMPAGLAFAKAKQDYYRTCHRDDSDECAMFTILEFNLFGCPLISMQPKLRADYSPTLLGHDVVEKQSPTYNPKEAIPAMGSAYQANDIHAYVRGLVDNNLAIIREKVEKEVYQRLGLGVENLQHIMRLSDNHIETGYQFIYRKTPDGAFPHFDMYYLVDTDTQGGITKIIHTK